MLVRPTKILALLALLTSHTLWAMDTAREDVRAFIDEMVSEHQFQRDELLQLFAAIELRPDIIETMTRPAESKPWHQYRPIFVTESRIRQGVEFWNQHAALLAEVEAAYGVPAEIIVAIVGVETRYGRHTGRHRVIDALATLGFDYPPRGRFFRGQLKEFLIMAREERRDPLEFTGSYAGAMGQPQFIPSSFRAYAVDQDGDGHRDLWENEADVLGSVANYFSKHHWRMGEPVVARATVSGEGWKALLEAGVKPTTTVTKLGGLGIRTEAPLAPELDAALIELEGENGSEYWVTLHNFYVITRYNRSPLYAMAVYQLSEAVRSTRQAQHSAGNG